ncbi:MAG TPA: ATP synthase subunit I [Steroidobacteraceae bacterium]|jgi:F1F0 ATPase subunit 2|nr:ATP synthase subunit I [Steroidobacteraceae bacterium]
MTGMGILLGALAAGIILGAVFFGGLWWTVSRGLTTTVPAVWFGLSALLRMAVLVCGVYYFARLGLPSLLAGLCGVVVARGAVKYLTRVAV